MNRVRDYNLLQGVSHVTDVFGRTPRDINHRHVTVENSGSKTIYIGVTLYHTGPIPEPRFSLKPKETKEIAINSHGGDPQYIWILGYRDDAISSKDYIELGPRNIFRSDSNHIVLREGLNMWFVQFFKNVASHR